MVLFSHIYRYQTKENFTLYKNDFVTLYIDLLKVVVNAEHSTGIYLSSSPTNGMESTKEGWVAKDPYDTKYGDGRKSLLFNYDVWPKWDGLKILEDLKFEPMKFFKWVFAIESLLCLNFVHGIQGLYVRVLKFESI